MANWLRRHIWQLAVGVLVLAGLVVGVFTLRNTPLEAHSGMPEDQRVFWRWVGTINQGAEAALESGLRLLDTHAHLPLLYLRLADVCREAGAEETCRNALVGITPPDSLTRLYREAARARLLGPDLDEAAVQRWKQIAEDPALDPGLARLLVDRGFQEEQPLWFTEIEQSWQQQYDADSTVLGAAFGLGYAAVRRFQWSRGEHLLIPLTRRAPDDPEAYRELGRIYFFTQQTDKLVAVLEAGIAAAEARHDLEQQLTLRGNLGWTLALNDGDLQKAEQFITKAIEQSRTLARGSTEAINVYRLAKIYMDQYRYDVALATLDSAQALYLQYRPAQLSEVLALRGFGLSRLYRFSDAEAVLAEAIAEARRREQHDDEAQVLVALAQLRYLMKRFAASREAGLEALTLSRRHRLTDHEITALTILGDVERLLGNFEAATTHYEQGLALATQIGSNVRLQELTQRLGVITLDLQNANAAEGYFEAMLRGIRQDGVTSRIAEAYVGLGRTYQQFDNFTKALEYYDLALAQLTPEDSSWLHAEVLTAKAFVLIQLGSTEEATALLNEARQRIVNNETQVYRVEAWLGYVHLSQGRYEQALRHYQQAEDVEQELPQLTVYWSVLYGKALASWHLQRPRQAEGAFREAIGVIETLRENLHSSTNRAYFVQNKVAVYESFATFLEEQGRGEEALYYTERARNRGLLDLLYTTLQGPALDPNRATDRLIEMNRRMQAIAQVFSEAETEEAPVYSATRMAQLRREYARSDSIYRRLRGDLAPEKRIYTFDPLRADAIRATLGANEALVVYDLRTVAGRDTPASVAYLVLADRVLVRRLSVQAEQVAESVRFLRDQLTNVEGEAATRWEPASRRLYQELIAPVLEVLPASVSHLNLVPEGMLHYLPFAALLDEDGHFLVERYTLSVAPSASILKLSRDRNPRRWRSMLLFANPKGRLPGSQKEVEAIASAGSDKRRHTLIGAAVTQANVETHARDYDILHFATHGRFDVRNPWRSHLELHGDDVLSVEEIGHLELDAYLVTLSACESALSGGMLSDVPNGDEWVGLNQAFLAAGTPTVMASLWPIDDLVSSDFMIQFYQALGPDGKARALATVQRHFIENPRTRHPFYWAPFSLIGDPL